MTQELELNKCLPIVKDDYINRKGQYDIWRSDPSTFEGKPTITAEEMSRVTQSLKDKFGVQIADSNLSRSQGVITEAEVALAHKLVDSIQQIEEDEINDANRRPWNASTLEHVRQVAVVSTVLAEEINSRGGSLDKNATEVKALFHDLGRSVTHHPVNHLIAGREMAKELGLSAVIRKTQLSHGEAGVGPYIAGITPDTWGEISNNPERLGQMVDSLPLEEVVIALADMAKRGVKQPDGTFVNTISTPLEGLAPSAKRRLTTNQGEPSDEILMNLASANLDVVNHARQTLLEMGASETNVNQMHMYFGWQAALQRRIVRDYGIDFDEIAEKSRQTYNEMYPKLN